MPKSKCPTGPSYTKELNCHLGEAKVLEKLKERFYWSGHVRDVKNWCQTCGACAHRKHPTPKNNAKLPTVCIVYPMQMVAADILDSLPEL